MVSSVQVVVRSALVLAIAGCSGGASDASPGNDGALGSGGLGAQASGGNGGLATGGQPGSAAQGSGGSLGMTQSGGGGANGVAGAGAGGSNNAGGMSGSGGMASSGSGGTSGSGGMNGSGGINGSAGMNGSGGMDGSGTGGMSGSGVMAAVDSGPMMCRAEATHMGGLTQYDQTALGNCGMPWPTNNLYGAMATDDYQASAVCGMCVEVTGPTGMKAVIQAVDQCPIGSNPKCVAGHIDLSHSAYAAVVPSNMPGEVPNSQPVSWHFVPCDASGPIVYHFKDGTHKDWLAVQIRNSRYGIAKMRWRKAGTGNYRDMTARTNDLAYFVADGPGTTTYDFEVTDVNGQVLADNGVQLVTNGDAQGHAQFPDCTQ
jgi:expansin (peptidoglycan-binding protein)